MSYFAHLIRVVPIRAFLVTSLAIVSTACSDMGQSGQAKLDGFGLTDTQKEIAEALITGYKNDTGQSILRSQDYGRAACYAKKVKMPGQYERAHLIYLKNYTQADENWDGFWQKHQINIDQAYKMAEIFSSTYATCP